MWWRVIRRNTPAGLPPYAGSSWESDLPIVLGEWESHAHVEA